MQAAKDMPPRLDGSLSSCMLCQAQALVNGTVQNCPFCSTSDYIWLNAGARTARAPSTSCTTPRGTCALPTRRCLSDLDTASPKHGNLNTDLPGSPPTHCLCGMLHVLDGLLKD